MLGDSITAIIHTKNEEHNVARAIRSVDGWCERILVVDMASTDATVSIAERAGAEVLHVPDFGYMEPARRLALAEVTTDWVLICDADEVIPSALSARLLEFVKSSHVDGAVLHARTFMFGVEVRGSGYSRAREHHLKLYRPGSVTNFDEIHKRPEPVEGATIVDLGTRDEECYLHFNYLGWSHYLQKFDRYTRAEAENDLRPAPLLVRTAKDVAVRMLKERAFSDGAIGIALVAMTISYRAVSFARSRLLLSDEQIHSRYNRIAADAVSDSQRI